jgi:uncharacterized integral membrane protein
MLRLLGWVILAICFIGFAISNAQTLELRLFPLLPFVLAMPAYIACTLIFLIGSLTGYALGRLKRYKRRKQTRLEVAPLHG